MILTTLVLKWFIPKVDASVKKIEKLPPCMEKIRLQEYLTAQQALEYICLDTHEHRIMLIKRYITMPAMFMRDSWITNSALYVVTLYFTRKIYTQSFERLQMQRSTQSAWQFCHFYTRELAYYMPTVVAEWNGGYQGRCSQFLHLFMLFISIYKLYYPSKIA